MHLWQSLSWMWWYNFYVGPIFSWILHFTSLHFRQWKDLFEFTKQCSKLPSMQMLTSVCLEGKFPWNVLFWKSLSHKDPNLTWCVHDSMSFVFYGHPIYIFKILQEEKDHQFKTKSSWIMTKVFLPAIVPFCKAPSVDVGLCNVFFSL